MTNFTNDPNMTWFRDNIKKAKGILIVPRLVRAGFIFGGSGGTGTLLRRHDKTGYTFNNPIAYWSYPAFYTMGSVTWGLQAGGEAAEVILLVMSDRGMDALLSPKVQLGANMSVTAGPVGAGAKAATADVLQYSRSQDLFGGLTLDGSVINPRDKFNHAYYSAEVTPLDILIQGDARNAQAYDLRAKLATFE